MKEKGVEGMKETGIIRRVDELGRVVLPIEFRRMLEIEEKDQLGITVEEDKIILRKHCASCIFCGSESELSEYRGKKVCTTCQKALTELEE